jgi:hypothetical protein
VDVNDENAVLTLQRLNADDAENTENADDCLWLKNRHRLRGERASGQQSPLFSVSSALSALPALSASSAFSS